jgi:hypothetical protein
MSGTGFNTSRILNSAMKSHDWVQFSLGFSYTIWLFNIAVANHLSYIYIYIIIDKSSINVPFSIAVLKLLEYPRVGQIFCFSLDWPRSHVWKKLVEWVEALVASTTTRIFASVLLYRLNLTHVAHVEASPCLCCLGDPEKMTSCWDVTGMIGVETWGNLQPAQG